MINKKAKKYFKIDKIERIGIENISVKIYITYENGKYDSFEGVEYAECMRLINEKYFQCLKEERNNKLQKI